MSKTINLPGYIIEGGGTFFGTPGDDIAMWGGGYQSSRYLPIRRE